MKRLSSLIVILLLVLSTLPVVVPQNLLVDQGDKTAALITDIPDIDNSFTEVFVQYLGTTDPVRIHYVFFGPDCKEKQNKKFDNVTPLDIVELDIPDEGVDLKLVVVVENNTNPNNLLDQPLLGIKYINDRTAWKNLPAMTSPKNQGQVIGPEGTINFNGVDYGLFPRNFISMPFLTEGDNVNSPPNFNRLGLNIFNGTNTTLTEVITIDDDEETASNPIDDLNCARLVELEPNSGFNFDDIGGDGIDDSQGIPPGVAVVRAGVGVVRTERTSGAIFGEQYMDRDGEDSPSDAAGNMFFFGQGSPVTNFMYTPLSQPQGIFTGDNENYQNPYADSAVSSIGIQKPVEDDLGTTDLNESAFNRETIFAIHNTLGAGTPAITVKARWDFITLDPNASGQCEHQDFNLFLSHDDVNYVRVSELTGVHLLPGEFPVIGVLTVWDPQSRQILVGKHYDVVMENTPECSDGVDNDNDGFIDTDLLEDECDDPFDDSELTDGVQDQVDVIRSVDAEDAMLTLSSTVTNGVATFESAKHFTTIVPVSTIDNDENYNVLVVNWDALDDPSAALQTLDFQVTDQVQNTTSLRIPAQCITLLDKQSFPGLFDGSDFGTNPDVISLTGTIDESNRGLAAFVYFNPGGLFPDENVVDAEDLAFTNAIHDGEVFTDIKIMPGDLPGPGGTSQLIVGITPSVNLTTGHIVNVKQFAAVPSGSIFIKGPVDCQNSVSLPAPGVTAGNAFAVELTGCTLGSNSNRIIHVDSTILGLAEIFVPKDST